MKYYQCRMRETGGNTETIGWIEERGAKVGASVELKDMGGRFFDVLTVSKMAFEGDALREKQANDRNAFASLVS